MNKQKVTIDTTQLTSSGIIERNDAAQIHIIWLNPEVGGSVIINGITLNSACTWFVLNGFREDIAAGEYGVNSYNVVLNGTAKVMVIRKTYEK